VTLRFDPGLYQIGHDAYLAADAAGSGDLKAVLRSPAHMVAKRAEEIRETPALLFGRALHAAVLEPEWFAEAWAVAPEGDRRTKAGKAAWEEFCRENAGRSLLPAGDMETIRRMQDAVLGNAAAVAAIGGQGEREGSLFWFDERTGERCKARPDIRREDGIIVDLKSCEDASPAGFAKACARFGYHVQDAHYADGHEAVFGAPCTGFVFVAVEKAAPYGVGVYTLDQEAKEAGRRMVRAALNRISACRLAKSWPCYSEDVQTLSLPRWATATKEGEEG
jgi:exodeoxyribonuclease VIII